LYLHVLDATGQTRFEKNLPANPSAFLYAVQPFRDGLVVGVECMFAWLMRIHDGDVVHTVGGPPAEPDRNGADAVRVATTSSPGSRFPANAPAAGAVTREGSSLWF
jgi:hypothetical protein